MYIDGFNAYNGIKAAELRNCRWLDWAAYAAALVDGDDLTVRYFTAVVNTPLDARERQNHYLRALRANGGLDIIEGKFMARNMECPDCGHTWKRPKEQFTDVNIAIAMTHDAREGSLDRAMLISGDSDLVPAVRYVQDLGIQVINVAPPRRKGDELASACDGLLHMDHVAMRRAQLPNPVMEAFRGGRKHRPLHAPEGWT